MSRTPLKLSQNYFVEETKQSQTDFFNSKPHSIIDYYRKIPTSSDEIGEESMNGIDDQSLSELKSEIENRQIIIEELVSSQNKLKIALSTLKAQNNSLDNELAGSRRKNYELDVQLYLVKEENNVLKEEAKSNQILFENKLKQSIQKIEELAKALNQAHELIAVLKSSQNHKQLSPDNFLIKKRTKSFENKLNTDRLKINHSKDLVSPEKNFNLTERSPLNSNSLIKDLLNILGIEKQNKIIGSVLNLRDNYKKYEKFFKQLSSVVLECSPSGSFSKNPNMKQVWKWLTRLLEEYMKIKKSI
jgi:hypothetical protein